MRHDPRAALRRQSVKAHHDGRFDDALQGYTDYLTRYPTDGGIWTNLGALYRTTGRHNLARIAQARAFAINADAPGVINNYANILSDLGEYDLSIQMRELSLTKEPDHLMHHAMIGRCHRGKGDYDAAIDYLTPKVAEFPEEPEIALQLAFAQLGAGHYGAAFRSYDARWDTEELSAPEIPFQRWEEGMSLKGKRLLILPEQGFGDMVLMVRFLPLLAAQGAKIHLVAKRPLQRLLQGIEGVVWMDAAASKTDSIDLWANLMDLPKMVYGPDDKGKVPKPTVLNVPDDSKERAKAITAQHTDLFKVGVVWTGSTTYKGNAFRSFSHREFLPMAGIPDVQLFSLYKGPALDAFKADGSAGVIIDAASADRDFADCAALMMEMDLIITSDTATAHIAGSLGLETWVMLHWDAFWVYRHKGDTTEWYPSMRLFRQEKPQDWGSAFDAAHAALIEKVEANV